MIIIFKKKLKNVIHLKSDRDRDLFSTNAPLPPQKNTWPGSQGFGTASGSSVWRTRIQVVQPSLPASQGSDDQGNRISNRMRTQTQAPCNEMWASEVVS